MFKHILKTKAVSLIEIIVTITIVFILASVAMYAYQDYKSKAQFNGALATAEQDKLAISSYYAKNKSCPTNTFITGQTISSSQCTTNTPDSCVNNITNSGTFGSISSGWIINLNDANGNTVLYFLGTISPLGDFQYFCVLGSTNAPPTKFLSITCNPNNFTLPSGYTVAQ